MVVESYEVVVGGCWFLGGGRSFRVLVTTKFCKF